MKTNGKIITISLLCLLLGGIIGFFVAGRITKKRIHNMVEMQRPPQFKYRLEDRLDLNDEQQEEFDQVFMEHMGRMRTMDRAMHEKRKAEIEQLFKNLETTLDSEQVEIVREFGERMKKRDKRRGNRPPRRKHMK